jgi:hypothetical protein
LPHHLFVGGQYIYYSNYGGTWDELTAPSLRYPVPLCSREFIEKYEYIGLKNAEWSNLVYYITNFVNQALCTTQNVGVTVRECIEVRDKEWLQKFDGQNGKWRRRWENNIVTYGPQEDSVVFQHPVALSQVFFI